MQPATPLKIAILGAGAVGLALGARLARSGLDTLFITRREEQARDLLGNGVALEDPINNETWTQRVPAVTQSQLSAEELSGRIVILCVRSSDTRAALAELARAHPGTIVANAQNDVHGDALVAELFDEAIGVVVRVTCTRVSDHRVRVAGSGRIVLGLHPSGHSRAAETLASSLRAAGYNVGVSEEIEKDRWLKLAINLLSTPNALVVREEHTTAEFVELKARLLEEARDIFSAAGIPHRSCDGNDRSLSEEIAHQRASLAAGTSSRTLPIYNQVWQALTSGGALEADGYHQRILELADEHAVPAPVNRRTLEILLRQASQNAGPESVHAREFLDRD